MKRLIIFAFFLLLLPTAIVVMVCFPLKFLIFIACALFILGCYDILQKKHTILRNFPLFGHIRYMLETIRPEIQQYFNGRLSYALGNLNPYVTSSFFLE